MSAEKSKLLEVVLAVDSGRDGEGNCNGSAQVLKE